MSQQKKAVFLTGSQRLDRTTEQGISGLVVEYIVAIDVTRARFPADAYEQFCVNSTGLEVLQDPRMSCALRVRNSFWATYARVRCVRALTRTRVCASTRAKHSFGSPAGSQNELRL